LIRERQEGAVGNAAPLCRDRFQTDDCATLDLSSMAANRSAMNRREPRTVSADLDLSDEEQAERNVRAMNLHMIVLLEDLNTDRAIDQIY